jgi:hypothetical protein
MTPPSPTSIHAPGAPFHAITRGVSPPPDTPAVIEGASNLHETTGDVALALSLITRHLRQRRQRKLNTTTLADAVGSGVDLSQNVAIVDELGRVFYCLAAGPAIVPLDPKSTMPYSVPATAFAASAGGARAPVPPG